MNACTQLFFMAKKIVQKIDMSNEARTIKGALSFPEKKLKKIDNAKIKLEDIIINLFIVNFFKKPY